MTLAAATTALSARLETLRAELHIGRHYATSTARTNGTLWHEAMRTLEFLESTSLPLTAEEIERHASRAHRILDRVAQGAA